MKKIKGLFLAFVLLFVNGAFMHLGMNVAYADTNKSGDWEYVFLEDGTIEISSYLGNESEIIIPSRIEGVKVTVIGEKAFYGNDKIVSASVPATVKTISFWAFSNCSNLANVELQYGLINIDGLAFDMCDNLQSITIPSSVEDIGFKGLGTIKTVYGFGGTCVEEYVKQWADQGVEFIDLNENNTDSPIDISKLKVKLSKDSYIYNGKAKYPKVIIEDLVNDVDYIVEYIDNIEVGTAQVVIRGLEKYNGKVVKTFDICPVSTKLKNVKADENAFIAEIIKSEQSVTGYQIEYSTNTSFKGSKKVLVTSAKELSKKVSGLVADKKYYVRVRTYKTVDGKNYYSSWSSRKSVKPKLTSTKIKTINSKKSSLIVKWKKINKYISGYQIQYSTSKNFKDSKIITIKNYRTVSKEIKCVERDKNHYVRVRTYKKVKGSYCYSKWSAKKYIKVK